MDMNTVNQLMIFSLEALTAIILLLGLFRLRFRLGLFPLYVTLGVFQPIQVILSSTVYVEILPDMMISPGSAIMFTASIFAILLVYIREDATEARKVIYGIVIANITMSLMLFVFGMQLGFPDTINLYDLPPQIFTQSARHMLVGTITLFGDVVLVIFVYEFIGRYIPKVPFLRIYLTMVIILIFDTFVFITGTFYGQPNYSSIILAGVVGKISMAVFYTAALTMYLRFIEPVGHLKAMALNPLQDIFYALTYREKYKIEREYSERIIRESEARLNEAQHAAHIGSWELDLITNSLHCSDEVYRIFEMGPQQFESTYETLMAIIHPEDREFVNTAYTESVKNRTHCEVTHRLLLGDGSIKFVNDICKTFYDEEGNAVRSVGTVHDITKARWAEEERQKQSSRNQLILETTLDGYVLADPDGKIVDVNPAYCNMIGYSREALLNMNLRDLEVKIPPEEVDRRIQQMISHSGDRFETKYKHKDGHVLELDTNISVMHIDAIPMVAAFMRDVSDRKQAETDLVESEEKYRALVESLKEGIGKVDENESFTFVNQAAADIFGFSTEEMIGKNLKDFISARAFDQIQEQTAKRKAGDSSKYELEIIREIGANRIIEVNATPIESEQQEYQGTFGIFHDITDRKLAEITRELALQEATAANEVKDQFVANISHEVRTPLNSILGFSDLLKQRYSDIISEKDRDVFGYITAAGDRLMHTVDSILNLSMMKAGTINIQKQELDLGSIITQAVEQLKLRAQDKNLDLNFTLPKKPQIISADEYCIHQSILNLTENAIKYTIKGTVEIKLGHRDDRVTLSVIDTGIGISAEYQKRLFDAYTQESEGFTKSYQGIGLGLALTKQYLDLNDVEIELVSQKNIGTTFTLTFPKYEGRS